ncbi:circadian clock-controlled protein daywake-like [Leptopilina heterotoma]|uniref:circadian clock-controlled protein daywake-like n=1 Tax=Leptopilina heterotoma TaxID=63436 RepID=UPI001CA980DC|nr:circadian clock-controlled protein daywake-like [Leptopilina heterotoma]
MLIKSLFLILSLSAISIFAEEIPEFLKICKRNDPHFELCVKKSVEALLPYMKTGVPEYNIPSLEPLFLKELSASQGTGLKIAAKNVKVFGASGFKIKKLKVDTNEFRIGVDLELPRLQIEGQYNINGRILLLPIHGVGPMRVNVTDVGAVVRIKTNLYTNPTTGLDHIRISEFRLKVSISKGNIELDNLFGGDPMLGEVVNNAINNNFESFIRELQPLIEKALSEALLEISNSIVRPFTFKQLFPDN